MRNSLKAGTVLAGICLAGGAQAQAAPDAESLQEIQVTARLRRENVQDVPVAVSVIGAQSKLLGLRTLGQPSSATARSPFILRLRILL